MSDLTSLRQHVRTAEPGLGRLLDGLIDGMAFPARINAPSIGPAAALGTPEAGVTVAAERGDGSHFITVLQLTDAVVGLSGDNANKATGGKLYTFPEGDILILSAMISVKVTLDDAVQSDIPEIGLGSAVGTGVHAILGGAGATMENILEGVVFSPDLDGVTAQANAAFPTAGAPLLLTDAALFMNFADAWADLTDEAALTATGTVVVQWIKL